MYRGSNQRFGDNPAMKAPPGYPYPGDGSMPKMHVDGYSNPNPPLYDYPPPNNPNNPQPGYEFSMGMAPSNPPPPQNFERNYHSTWREVSQPKPPMSMPGMGPSAMHPVGPYDVRPMPGGPELPSSKPEMSSFLPSSSVSGNPSNPPPASSNAPQVNVVQRISGLIKSQLSGLQAILAYADRKTAEQRIKRERSRSRSRDRGEKGRSSHRQWNCPKCNYLNFDFRDKCKKCDTNKPPQRESHHGLKTYVPGPDDWRCLKCNNINYARRTECHRCHMQKGK